MNYKEWLNAVESELKSIIRASGVAAVLTTVLNVPERIIITI